MVSEFDALRTAKLMVEKHGEQEAWRNLTARAIDEHLLGRVEDRAITHQVLLALQKLTERQESDQTRH